MVLSNKMQKSVVVASYHFWEDTVHKKKVQRRTKLMAHDEENQCNIGDWVGAFVLALETNFAFFFLLFVNFSFLR